MRELESSPNPYAAPQAPLTLYAEPNATAMQQANGQWYYSLWPLLFLFNLGVPLLLGLGLCSISGYLGVGIVTVGLLIYTTYLVSRNPLLRLRWLTGSLIVGLMQLFPVVHLMWGMSCVQLLITIGFIKDRDFDFAPNNEKLQFLPAALLTLLVGGGLLGFALVVGYVLRRNTRIPPNPEVPEND